MKLSYSFKQNQNFIIAPQTQFYHLKVAAFLKFQSKHVQNYMPTTLWPQSGLMAIMRQTGYIKTLVYPKVGDSRTLVYPILQAPVYLYICVHVHKDTSNINRTLEAFNSVTFIMNHEF